MLVSGEPKTIAPSGRVAQPVFIHAGAAHFEHLVLAQSSANGPSALCYYEPFNYALELDDARTSGRQPRQPPRGTRVTRRPTRYYREYARLLRKNRAVSKSGSSKP